MTGKERIHLALELEKPDRVPVFEWFVDESVCRALTGSADIVEVAAALDLDAVNIRADYEKQFSSDDTYTDEWGITKQLTGDCIPAVIRSPITDIARWEDYTFPDPRADNRLASLAGAVERIGDRRAVIFNVRDGFSDLRDLLGYEEALMQPLLAPAACAGLLDRIADYNIALVAAAVERCGIDVVATTDDVATRTGLLFPPAVYDEIIGPCFRKVIAGFKECGCKVIKHCDGDIMPLLEFWIDCGIDCIDPIDPSAGLTLAGMKEACGDRICLKGNVDCMGALQHGTPEEVAAETRECLRIGGPSGYILSSSNTIHRGVKPENFTAMLETLREAS